MKQLEAQQIKSDTGIIEFAVTGYGANKLSHDSMLLLYPMVTRLKTVSIVLGDTRWNTPTNLLETYNGSGYDRAGSVVL